MANPTDPTSPNTSTDVNNTKNQVDDLSNSFKNATDVGNVFNSQLGLISNGLNQLNNWLDKSGVHMQSLGNVTGTAATKFGLLTNFIVGATPHFKNFAGIDTSRLGSFNDQISSLFEILGKQGTALGVSSAAGKELVGILGKMGLGGRELSEVMKMTGPQLSAFAKNVLEGADNVLRLQSAQFQAMAQAGNLNEIYKGTGNTFQGVGEELQRLNEVTQAQINVMKDADLVTHKGIDSLGQYATTLLQIPGGAEAMMKGIDLGGQHINTLTGILQLADGAGLDINQTFQDIHQTVAQFGVGIDDATRLISRYVDTSQDLHAQQKDVREAILKVTDAYHNFTLGGYDSTKMMQGLTDSVKNWSFSLEKAGVPAQNALKFATDWVSSMKNMTEGQEAFISQQTGGAGGLLGSLQFEEMMRTNPAQASAKIAEVMRQQMTRMGFGGQIISRDQAISGGQSGARQYELQRQLAMSGIFGMKAQSKEEADAMIMALQKGGDIGKAMSAADKKAVESETMERGAKQEQLAYTGIKQATITAQYASLTAGDINLGFLEKSFSARSGAGTEGAALRTQDRLRQRMNEAAQREPGSSGTATLTRDIGNLISDAGKYTSAGISSIKQQMSGNNTALPFVSNTATMPINTALNTLNALDQSNGQGFIPAGKQVGAAINTNSTNSGINSNNNTTSNNLNNRMNNNQPIPVTLASGSHIMIDLTTKCPSCGWEQHTSEQARAFNTPSQSPNR